MQLAIDSDVGSLAPPAIIQPPNPDQSPKAPHDQLLPNRSLPLVAG